MSQSQLITINPAIQTHAPSSHNMEHGQQYSFYLHDSGSKPAPSLYSELISQAQAKVSIWDPYIHDADMEVFNNIATAIEIEILTMCEARNWQIKKQNCLTALKSHISDNLLQGVRFRFAYIGTDINPAGIWHFHDRFLMIDDEDFYLIGSSVEYHHSPHSSTGIYHIEHEADKMVIREAYDKTFNKAVADGTLIFIPNLI